MTKTIGGRVALAMGILGFSASMAMAEELSAETVAAITAKLAEMQCEVDPENIEADGEGYELDDVFCADGQYDMDLSAALEVVNKRKE